ncbi:very short patch repair endonuclease [Streptomyces sp. NBC_01471]|uniref:very short patch repair endonuclease n=1 Tax=Streptomyces sp. NBC_01471 TaxID=2903879 RepID=UPI00324F7F89
MPEDETWVPPEGSWASSAARRRNMQAIRSRDTKPEQLVRRLVHANGLRYRVAARPLPDLRRTADLVFRPAKVAVFIDGCYWHGCPEHYQAPRTNPGYWSEKVAGNMARDRDTDLRLNQAGWTVLRFWEHEPPEECAGTVSRVVADRRRALLKRKLRGNE